MKHLIIASHRRSGTHLSIDLFRKNILKTENYVNLDSFVDSDQKNLDKEGLERKLSSGTSIIKTHLLPDFSLYLEENDANYLHRFFQENEIFYVKRDGRDVMVSLFHYVQNFDQEAKVLSFSDFLKTTNSFDPGTLDMSRPKFWAHHVKSWQQSKFKLHVLSFERIIEDYANEVALVAQLLGLSLTIPDVDVRLKSSNFLVTVFRKALIKLGLNKNNTAVGFRKGQKGEYKKYFAAEDLAFFDHETNY